MIVLDTTILSYAVGQPHPLRPSCVGVIRLARDGLIRATTTIEVIQEFLHVRSRRRPRADAARLAARYAKGLAPLLQPDEQDLAHGIRLFTRNSELGAFDAVLAAAARRRGFAVASADGAFGSVRGLRHLDPATPSFLADAEGIG